MAYGKKCRYETCRREARKNSDECQACATRYHYWDTRTAAKRVERRIRLELSGETMREFVGDTELLRRVRSEFTTELKHAKRERKAKAKIKG